MSDDPVVSCPGCGLELPDLHLEVPAGFNANGECYQQFNELSFYTLSLGYQEFLHQTAIDAYEAQHVGEKTKNITAAFGLIGLYLALERGYTGRQVQLAHMKLANRNKNWPRLEPPSVHWTMTVADVLQAPEGQERNVRILEWGRAVWDGWADAHGVIRQLVELYSGI